MSSAFEQKKTPIHPPPRVGWNTKLGDPDLQAVIVVGLLLWKGPRSKKRFLEERVPKCAKSADARFSISPLASEDFQKFDFCWA